MIRLQLVRHLMIAGCLICSCPVVSPLLVAADEESAVVMIHADAVHTGTGQVLSPGSVLIRDGKIAEVGENLSADGARILNVKTLIPGLVDASSRSGLGRLDDEVTKEITPELFSSSVVDWTDRDFAEQIAAGTTCINLCPSTSNVVAGISTAVKTAGRGSGGIHAERIVCERTGLMISVCSDPASGNTSRSRPDSIYVRQPTNRMGVVWMLRSTFHKARTADAASVESQLTTVQEALSGTLPLFAVSRTQYDIQALMTLSDEFDFRPVLIGGQEAWQVTEELAERQIPVILHRTVPGSSRGDERTRVCADMAARLQAAGIPFCLAEGDLLDQARFAVRTGLPAASALAAITSSPAEILGIGDRVGSIAVGKDADLVALDGAPLAFTTSVQWVMVDGTLQFEQADNP